MKALVPEYKCRKCEEVFDGVGNLGEIDALFKMTELVLSRKKDRSSPAVNKMAVHYCKNGRSGLGIGDIIGCRTEER